MSAMPPPPIATPVLGYAGPQPINTGGAWRDGALIVTNPAGAELMRFPSIHKGAGLTIQEGREGERLAPFSNPAAKLLGDHQECTEQQIAGEIGSDRLRAGKSEPAPVSARAA